MRHRKDRINDPKSLIYMVRTEGLEPSRGYPLRILSPVCLPVPPRPHLSLSPYRFAIRSRSTGPFHVAALSPSNRPTLHGFGINSNHAPPLPAREGNASMSPGFGHAWQKFGSGHAPCSTRIETTWHASLLLNKLAHDGRGVASARGDWPKGNLAAEPTSEPSASSRWRRRARAPRPCEGIASRPLQVAVRHTHQVRSPAAEVAAAHCRSDRTFPRFLLVRYSALTAAADVPGA